jgi:DNA-binding NarL/FixJ family response regulator
MQKMEVSIFIADDHQLVIDGLKMLLAQAGHINIYGDAINGLIAEQQIIRLKPDIALLDVRMPEKDGLKVLQSLQHKGCTTKCIMLSMHEDARYIKDAEAFGAKGYLLKNVGKVVLLEAISKVMKGGTCFHTIVQTEKNQTVFFTPREKDVIGLLAKGHSTNEIASLLFTSQETIKVHRKHIREKTGATNSVELLIKLKELGFDV